MISIFFIIIFFIIFNYLFSLWRIIKIKKMKHFMKMTFKRFKIRISILNYFVVQINVSKNSHRELKKRLFDTNHSSFFHFRSLRRRKMNQNLFFFEKKSFSSNEKKANSNVFDSAFRFRSFDFRVEKKVKYYKKSRRSTNYDDLRKLYFSQIFITVHWFKMIQSKSFER